MNERQFHRREYYLEMERCIERMHQEKMAEFFAECMWGSREVPDRQYWSERAKEARRKARELE
jgi:alpha-D-ribose 1-methylphosphonate 5-triphosphate diphosphatase PhnM